MNLNRYKVKLPNPDIGARPLELVGTWTIFGGFILFAVILGAEGYRGGPGTNTIAYVVGGMYAFAWISARNKWVLLIFILSTFFTPLLVLQNSSNTIDKCRNMKQALFAKPCDEHIELLIVFSFYVFSVFLVSFYGLYKKSKPAV